MARVPTTVIDDAFFEKVARMKKEKVAMADLQDKLVRENGTYTTWTPELQAFFTQCNVDLDLIKQAFAKSRQQDGPFDELDTFMTAEPTTWTPATNDQFICLWMASADQDYLRYLRDNVAASGNVMAAMSATWALGSLKQQYGLAI